MYSSNVIKYEIYMSTLMFCQFRFQTSYYKKKKLSIFLNINERVSILFMYICKVQVAL